MFARLFTRALAAVVPQNEYILPRWATSRSHIAPLREIVIVDGDYFYRTFLWRTFADI
jgi:hypothetical protein